MRLHPPPLPTDDLSNRSLGEAMKAVILNKLEISYIIIRLTIIRAAFGSPRTLFHI
jgi:hypothetical protein